MCVREIQEPGAQEEENEEFGQGDKTNKEENNAKRTLLFVSKFIASRRTVRYNVSLVHVCERRAEKCKSEEGQRRRRQG